MYKGYGINPEAPPVTKLDNETLDRISYQYGIPQPSASPILKSSSMINPDSFMSRVDAAATEIKLASIPATPDITPLSLSSEAVEAINSAAANTPIEEAKQSLSDITRKKS